MNYEGSTCICRVPKAQLRPGTFVECVHCGRWRRERPMRLTVQAAVVAALLTSCDLRHRENALPPAARWYCAFFFSGGLQHRGCISSLAPDTRKIGTFTHRPPLCNIYLYNPADQHLAHFTLRLFPATWACLRAAMPRAALPNRGGRPRCRTPTDGSCGRTAKASRPAGYVALAPGTSY